MPEPREQLRDALSSFLTAEQMTKLVDEVLAIEKRVHCDFTCKKCGQNQFQYGTISDAKAVALALPDLLNQAYGRVGDAAASGEPIVLVRVNTLEEAEATEPSAQGRSGRRRKTTKGAT